MFTFDVIGQILWSSFANSSYAMLFALAFSLVLKVNGVFNFAQAAMMTAAFYGAFTMVAKLGLPGWAGFVVAQVLAIGAGMAIEWFGYRSLRLRRASPLFVFIFALILSELVAYTTMLIFGTWPSTIFASLLWPVTLVGNIAISDWDIPAVLSALASCAALFLFLRYTRPGQSMVAVADNADLAELYGIDKARIYVIAIAIAGSLVGLGMFLYGTRAQVQPMSAIELMLFAVIATIVGGIGNIWGAALSALALGIVQNSSVLFIPSEWQGLLIYILLFVAIIFFPNGVRLPSPRLGRQRTPTPVLTDDQPGS
ncbi:branched-chain amino acid ABC transporter permease [Bosea sp. (in: a-proteobacteria)]|uniref:branched-chain amino acid ABC transporter permease n=1 Tax=Bosea sp. (in: a-proteobacteria) TaxID=1871050 RepID=UPI00261FE9BF|nr:branched-chain amino acid ABC transporter permease [Bosea sp. (in: a-proteobacteria)]MCO5090596.1 branched-chain amino acid ABC transporter permease [Bosea sp. (in: a-proteobacteria)]